MAQRKTFADIFHNEITAWIVLGVSLLITAAGWYIASYYVDRRAQDRFQYEVEDARQRILKRMLEYEQVLRGGVGLFKSSGRMVSRDEWRRYVEALELHTYFPGIQGIGVSLMLEPSELPAHIDAVRAEGFSDYTVKPAGERERYSAIVYLEPFDWRNQRAFGYDMYSNPMRRSAMERARDTGLPSVSGRVTLVQETEENMQAGFLVYLPLYQPGKPLDTVAQRRAALLGYVYSPFRMNDLMRGILGSDTPDVSFEIYDGAQTQDESTLLYNSGLQATMTSGVRHDTLKRIELPGRSWVARFHSTPSFEAAMSSSQPELIATGGLVVDILLFSIIWSLAGARRRVQARAEAMTADIRHVSERLELAQESAQIGTWDLDLRSNRLFWDERTFKLYDRSPEDFDHSNEFWKACVLPEDVARLEADFQRRYRHADRFDTTFRIRHRNGAIRFIETQALVQKDSDGTPVRMVGVNMDITERRQAEERLTLAASVFEHAHEGIIVMDEQGRILDVNPAFTKMTGYSHDEVVGETTHMLRSGRHDEAFFEQMWQSLRETGFWRGEVWSRRKDGELYAEMLSISAIRHPDAEASRYVAVFSDITILKHQQERLLRLAHYDALTQLPNRVLLADRLNSAMAQARRTGMMLAVCYLDLDGFKPVNDRYGHEVGDKLLVKVAERLNSHMRGSDSASRLGGDEFVLLFGDLRSIEECQQAVSRLLQSISATFNLDGHEVLVSASAGVTLYPNDDADADTLVRHADQAMYRAKESGRNRYQLFDPERDRQARAYRETLERIKQALESGEFELYYQPKVDMRDGTVLGAEALLRWNHPEQGMVLPGEFLPIVEESDFAIQLGEWVLDEALRQLALWNDAGFTTAVSVNISGHHFHEERFAQRLKAMLEEYASVKPSQLELEVLESTALEDINLVSRVIEECRALGVAVSIDDFGTGYSSLTYLKRLPVDTLKIDQSFVRDMLDDIEDFAIVEGIIGLSQAFRRDVIAEGIESEEHGVMLLRLGCNAGQGYGIARPMPAGKFPGWAGQYSHNSSWRETGKYHWIREDHPLFTAELLHRRWFDDLSASINAGIEVIPPPEINRDKCRFGTWCNNEGRTRYGHHEVFNKLNAEHENIHNHAAHVIELAKSGRTSEAKRELEEMGVMKKNIVQLLQALQETAAKRL